MLYTFHHHTLQEVTNKQDKLYIPIHLQHLHTDTSRESERERERDGHSIYSLSNSIRIPFILHENYHGVIRHVVCHVILH